MPGFNLNITCFKCLKETTKEQNLKIGWPATYTVKNFDMDGIAQIICPKCKSVIIAINQAMDFEIYFQCAIERFIENNLAETVFFLTKSRETFFKYVLELLLFEKMNNFDREEFWKSGIHLSERRLGGLASVYYYRFGEILKLNQFDFKIRNSIIHDNKYPSKEDTIDFGNNIINTFNIIMKKLMENIERHIIFQFNQIRQESKVNAYISTFKNSSPQIEYCSDSIISWNTFTPCELEQNKKREVFAISHPKEWEILSKQANDQNKNIYIKEDGSASLQDIPVFDKSQKSIYQETENFEKLVEIVSQKKKMEEQLTLKYK